MKRIAARGVETLPMTDPWDERYIDLEPQTAIHLLVVGYQLDDFHQFFT